MIFNTGKFLGFSFSFSGILIGVWGGQDNEPFTMIVGLVAVIIGPTILAVDEAKDD